MKLKLIAVIPVMFMASSAFAIEGETSTVNFTGNIVEDTCVLDSGSKDQVVPLGDVSVSAFSGTGTVSQGTSFSIGLESCNTALAETAAIVFSGSTEGSDGKVLTTSEFSTTNVGIQIQQAGTPLSLDGSASSAPQTLSDGSNSLDFTAHYVAMSDTVTAGEANGTANFTVNYE